MLVAPARLATAISTSRSRPRSRDRSGGCSRRGPLHLLAAAYADWDALLYEALAASEKLPQECVSERRDLASCTWGRVNAVRVAHPLSGALPLLHGFLDMPTVQPPGAHHDMPRIQGPDFGASERFSVSPGHEQDAYFHMPGGAKRPSALAVLSRRVRRLGARPPDAAPTGAAAHELVLEP